MERIHHGVPRPGWEAQVVEEGLVYLDSLDENGKLVKYWRDAPHYLITQQDYEWTKEAGEYLWPMCVQAGETMLEYPELTRRMGIPDHALPEIRRSWKDDDTPHIYSRFDLRFAGESKLTECDPSLRFPKLYEINADTPTSLLESSIIQHNWLEQGRMLQLHSGQDQYNSLHEALILAWQQKIGTYARKLGREISTIHFVYTKAELSGEDQMNTVYMAATAQEAGYCVKWFHIEDLQTTVMHDGTFVYRDPNGEYIDILFKLYPWEWLTEIVHGGGIDTSPILRNRTTWIEPAYKMLWSNKGLLPVLWELYKDDPIRREFLLPAYFTSKAGEVRHEMPNFVRKPLLGREGANVTIFQNGEPMQATNGIYGEEGFVDQELALLPNFVNPDLPEDDPTSNNYALVGLWMIDSVPQGIGIRESHGPITNNTSYFVPHASSTVLYDPS